MKQNIVHVLFFRKLFKWNFSEQNAGNKCKTAWEYLDYGLRRVQSDIPANLGKK